LDEHFRALGASRLDAFWRLRVPAALPSFVDGLKIAMPLAVIGAIVGEFVGAEKGLGHLMLFATANGRTDVMFAAIVAITLLAVAFYWLVELASRLIWWRGVNV
ncbi:MAG: ABC transporter permease, partial [Blastocatellia bacterium]